MKSSFAAVGLLLGASLPFGTLAQDSAKVSPNVNQVLVDNAQIRVVKSTFKPGTKEGVHTHPAGWYVVTHGGTLKITYADGKVVEWKAPTGEQAWQEFESPHSAENVGKTPFEYIYVEVKSAAKTGSAR
jgi:quercetin dioxygenase-like cupin family protein